MAKNTITLDDALYEYLLSVSLREGDLQARLRAETGRMSNYRMQISPDQGQFMALLVELIGARRTLEIGVFTGYSALSVALALPDDGQLVACDVSEEWTAVARRYWEEAGVAHKIALHVAPAIETLDALLANGEAGAFDFAFIDADKPGYAAYVERCLALLRPGGLMAVDNTLWDGRVIDPSDATAETRAIRELNASLHRDPRVTLAMVPVGDGLTLARKRGDGETRSRSG